MTFKRSDSLVVSEIKPKVISDIVNRTVAAVAPRPHGPPDTRSVKEYLLEFVGAKNNSETDFARAKEVLLAIKTLMKDTKWDYK